MRGADVSCRSCFVLLAGCSFQASCGGGRLDMEKARSFVSSFVEQYTKVKPTKVTCPDEVKAEKGKDLVCTFDVAGVTGTVTMQQTDTEGSVTVSSVTGIIASAKIEEAVQAEFKKRGPSPTIDCGARVHPSKPGDVIRCDARDGQNVVGHVAVTIKDEQNNVDFKFVPAGAAAPDAPPTAAPGRAPSEAAPSTAPAAPAEPAP